MSESSSSRKRKSPSTVQAEAEPTTLHRRSSRLSLKAQNSALSTNSHSPLSIHKTTSTALPRSASSASTSSSSSSTSKKPKREMPRKQRGKNSLTGDSDADPMDLDINKTKAASPKLKKAKQVRKAAAPTTSAAISNKRKSSKRDDDEGDDDENDEDEEPPFGEMGHDEEDSDGNPTNAPEGMEDFMAAILNAAGSGAAPPSRSALFNAMFGGGGGGGGPFGGSQTSSTASSSNTTGRFAEILKQLNGRNQEVQMIALQELSEELSVATEDMFMGYGRAGRMQGFSTPEFTTALLKLIGPQSPMDDAAFAQQFMMDDDDFGGFGGGGGHMTSEIMLLSCRCLSNLIEANPGASSVFISNGGVKILVDKLKEIEYIELAEQVLQVLEKVCIEYPHAIIKENGLVACVQYLDFFSLHVQRTAVSIVSKSCKGLGVLNPGSEKTRELFTKLKEIIPILESLLTNADSKIVESAVTSLESIIQWSVRDETTLESLVTPSLVSAIMAVLRPNAASTPITPFSSSVPVNGTPTSGNPTASASSVGTGIFTQLIRMLVNICKGSTKLSVELLKPEYGVTDSVYSYLTGGGNVPSQLANICDVKSRMGIDSGVLSSMVMNSIVSRGSDQVIQVLVLACELFPALPKVGSEWCMKIDDPLVEEVHQTKDVNEKGKEAGKQKPTASSSSSTTAPIPTRTLRSNSAATKSAPSSASSTSAEFPQESFDTRRRNVMDSTPTTKAFLETYAFHLLPILIEVFSTSVHPRIRRLAVETVAKCVWFVNDGVALGKVLLDARGFGKFVYELLGMRNLAFRAAVVQSSTEENVGRGSVVSIVDRDRAESFVFVSAGVQLTSIVVHKCGAKIVGWLIREGILSEMRKSVEELECLVEKENRVENPSAVTSFVDPAGAGTGRAVRSASADRKGKSVAIGNESLASPPPTNAASFLEGMKSALERMAGAVSTSDSPTASANSPSARTESTLTGLNGEVYLEKEAKQWLLHFASLFLQTLGENKALLSAGTNSSFDVLSDLKRVSRLLKKGKKENVPGITSSPSKNNEANDSKSALVLDDLMLEELQRIAQHFAGVLNKDDAQNVGVTGFEVLESGIIEGLTNYLTSPGLGEPRPENCLVIYQTPLNSRLQAFLHIFLDGHKPISSVASSPTSRHIPGAFKQCVSRLQECLSRVEDFKLTVAVPSLSNSSVSATDSALLSMFGSLIGGGGSSQSATAREQASPALQLARQIKLWLICEDPETVPPQFRNAVISIHAIATIKTFEDFLRGKVAGYSSSSGSSAAIGVAAGSEVVGLDETAKVGNSSESEDKEKNEDCDDLEDEEDREEEEHDENDEDADEEVNVLEELMEAEGELNEGRPSSAAVDLIPPPSPTKKMSPSRASSPTKSVASAASSALPKPAAPSSTYASAAASLQNSFSIKFFLEGTELLADETIFGALYRMEQSKSDDSSAANIWNKTFTLKYKKVPKEAEAPSTTPSKPAEGSNAKNIFEFNDSSSLDGESKAVKILFLLRILFVLNTRWNEFYEEQNSNTVVFPVEGVATAADGANLASPRSKSSIITPLPPISFVNNKVTAKLNRQLNEPLIVASQVLPEWCNRVACDFSFLVPFESRVTYLQSTAFGYARCINRWKQSEGNSSTSNNSSSRINPSSLESAMMGGRVQRQKVRVSRNRLIDSMCKVMDLYGQGSHSIEVEFFDEVGTGLGPTLEFYSSVCKEMRKREGVLIAGSGGVGKSVVLWRENGGSGDYLNPSEGLFPAPIGQSDYESDEGRSRLSLLQSLGSFVAKALLDSRIVDMPFSTLFLDMAVGSRHIGFGGSNPATFLHLIKHIDVSLYSSLSDVYKFAQLKASIDSKETLSESDKKVLLAGLTVKDARLEDLCLDFTLPGYPSVEIKPNGANIPITLENVSEYIDRVVDMTVGSGIRKQVDAFRTGFDRVFPISKLKCFSLEELCLLMGGTLDEDWSYLIDAIKADHGYSIDSKPVQNLVEMMEKFTLVERREFLMFVTGSPKLPIGGFKALNPQLTVVRKNADFGQNADSYLPSVMTCVNYLKVPAYTSLDVMRERFEVAMKEGQGSFHLS